MREYIESFLSEHGFSEEDREKVLSVYDAVSLRAGDDFVLLLSKYGENVNLSFEEVKTACNQIAEKVGFSAREVNLTALIALSKRLKEEYEARNFSDALFFDTTEDFKYKNEESKLLFHTVGYDPVWWADGFFNLTRFKLGRLQFEIRPSKYDYSVGKYSVRVGDPVVYMHIPRTGERLAVDGVLKSLSLARDFFNQNFPSGVVPFGCSSWLLFPNVYSDLKDGSNVKAFYDLFDILYSREFDDNSEMWRLFDQIIPKDYSLLPENGSLRKVYKAYMTSGKTAGLGEGFFFFDCVRVLNRKNTLS